MRKRGTRSGFTSVDLIALIVVFAALASFAVPGCNNAQEAQRRMQCTNNLKTIVLAMQNYHDVHGAFPAGCAPFYGMTNASDGPAVVGATVRLLPHIDEVAALWPLFNQESATSNGRSFFSPESTFRHTGGYSVFSCPADPRSRESSDLGGTTKYNMTRSSYIMCFGDCPGDSAFGTGSDAELTDAFKSPFARGVFATGVWRTYADITDGTSDALAFCETLGRHGKERGGIVIVADALGSPGRPRDDAAQENADAPADDEGPNVAACLPAFDAFDSAGDFVGADGLRWLETLRGVVFGSGHCVDAGFNTILPPNSPSCVRGDSIADSWGVFAPSSGHEGGVNAARCDGSVAFISNAIDCGDPYADPVGSGRSPYGIWGALGTVAGTDSPYRGSL